jgi:hypothetical protein
MKIRQSIALAVSLALSSTAFAGIGSDKTVYMGGYRRDGKPSGIPLLVLRQAAKRAGIQPGPAIKKRFPSR